MALLASAPAQAAPGDFDPTFSGDGKETTDFGKDDSGSGVVLQPDGKIVVAGSSRFDLTQCGDNGCESESHADSALARYNADGTLDTSFSDDGKETTDFGGYHDVALQPDGKIVVVGTEGFERCVDIWCDSFTEFAVARYNADGTLDTSFSDDGKQTIDFSDPAGFGDSAYGVALQPDGKIVVAGSSGGDRFALARYNGDGSLDTSFSDDGKQTTVFGCCENGARGVAFQADGKIVAVGRTGGDDFALARYNADGTLDTSFSDDGTQTTDLAGWDDGRAVAIQADGKILAVGTTNGGGAFVGDDDFALARYHPDGSLDTTFSSDGKQSTNFADRHHDDARGVALQPDGKIVAVGYSTAGGGTGGDTGFALARYNADGTLDTSFGGDGRQNSVFGHTAFDVALQPDGKIVASGSSGPGGGDFALARYEGGSEPPDTTPPPEPAAAPPAGAYREPQSVSLSSEAGASIHYTTDGSDPSSADPRFDAASPIQVRESQTIRALAIDEAGNESSVASHAYTILPDYRREVLGTSGLVSYWRLGETSGPTAADAKGANHGRYRNGVRLGRRGALLHDADTSARFDGTDDFVRVAHRASLDTGNRFTLEAWVKRSGTSSAAKTVLSKGSGSYRLSFVNNVLTLTKAGAGTVARASVATKDTTGFHHVVATKSGPRVRLYIDGVDRTGAVTHRRIANTSTALNVGRDTSGSEYFPGLIDEVAIYKVALPRAQVQRHFKASGR